MSIFMQDSFPNAFGTNQTTLLVTNSAIGDYRLLSTKVSSGSSFPVSSVAGGGVTTWTKLFSALTVTEPGNYEIWGGVVTSTSGTPTITVTFSATTGVSNELWSSEVGWSGGTPRLWLPVTGNINVAAAGGTLTFPSLTSSAVGIDQAFWGSTRGGGSAITGCSTAGFTCSTANANGNASIFNGTLLTNTSYAPAMTPSPTTAAWGAWGVILQVVPPRVPGQSASPMSQAVARASNWFKRESGLHLPERGLVVPRLA